MKEAGINTVRVYEPIDDIAVLDQFKKAGIKVVISFGYNQQGKFDIVSGTFINYIRKYKNHDAILMWELGNEYNYNPQWFGGDINNWYKSMELVSQIIQIEDPSRLVSSAHGDLPSKDALKIASSRAKIWRPLEELRPPAFLYRFRIFRFSQNGGRTLNGHQIQRFEA